MSARPLEGVRVLDLTHYEAGPTGTLLLAFLGADVIKVEDPVRGSAKRRLFSGNQAREDLYFVVLNLNKRSVTLDLRREGARDLLLGLVERCDVFVENFSEEALRRHGLTHEELVRRNPRLVYASIRGYGPDGPRAAYPSLDMTAQAMGGLMSLTGLDGAPPLRCGATVADSGGGTNLALGIAAALFQRERTGRGARVEVTLEESAIGLGRTLLGTHMAYGETAGRTGNELRDVVPWNVYGTADSGWVAICAIPQALFERLMAAIGEAGAVGAHELHSLRARKEKRGLVDGLIAAWVGARDKVEVMRVLCEAGVPCGIVRDSSEIAQDAYLRERGMVLDVDHPEWGRVRVPGCPVRVSGTARLSEPCSALGADNDVVYRELLGLSEVEVNTLRERRVI
ncbi:MAG: CoA transferase [Deltaproteobacteria bacterium]|nr:CoA transferase [Deltaproteobacteria bacterium]